LIFGLKLQEKRISHGRKTKNKQKNLPRNYTEKTRKEAEAETRKEEKAEAFATD
jgi:hypothetical protein